MRKKIKVLWFCNVVFTGEKSKATGSWLFSMSESLINTNEVDMYNISIGDVEEITQKNYGSINQFLIPRKKLGKNGLPPATITNGIKKIVENIKPDLIHIWGTEGYWGLLYSRGIINGNAILEIQGLKYAYAKYFYSGLSFWDIIGCFGLKELLMPSRFLPGLKRDYERWGKFEIEMLSRFNYISTQSDWVRTYVRNINEKATLIKTKIALRKEFLDSAKWDVKSYVPFQVFTSSSSSSISYKGLHILIDAIHILKQRFPNINLHIAGSLTAGIRTDGYSKWLRNKILKNDLTENITWLGSLDSNEIVSQIKKANVVVIPSFIETYCLALDESLTVGAPTVVSFSGAMPELAQHGHSALFYTPGDVEMCANAIETIFVDEILAQKLSENAYNDKSNKNNEIIALEQLSNYKKVIND